MEIKKNQGDVEKYVVRVEREWAILYIDEPSGVFSAFTSWGNWAYSWQHHGCPSLKHFLIQIARERDDYFERKLAGTDWFDRDRTEVEIKRQILYERKVGILDEHQARSLWNEMEEFTPNTTGEYFHWLGDQSEELKEVIGFDEPIYIQGPPPAIREFKKRCFIPFAEYLKKELSL